MDPAAFVQIIALKYAKGAGISPHIDNEQAFGPIICGVSLASPCRLQLREPDVGGRWWSHTIEPRSLYVLSGPARFAFQHRVPAVAELRYAVTLRTAP